MKKLVSSRKVKGIIGTVLAMSLMVGCANSSTVESESSSSYKIGITQIVDHQALNQVREGFENKSKEIGLSIDVEYQNAQGDVSTSQMIADKYVSDKKDLILAISTPSAQSAQNATKTDKMPVLFAAVSDPESSNLVGNENSENISGVTDKTTRENILSLVKIANEIKPEKKTIGVIYNIGEVNSTFQVSELKEIAKEVGVEVVEVGISSISDIDQAIEVISEKTDALYLLADNMLASSMRLISQKAISKNLITVSAVESFVDEGALLSLGINYTKIGEQVAEMAKKILVDKVDVSAIKYENPTELSQKINEKTAEALGFNVEELNSIISGN